VVVVVVAVVVILVGVGEEVLITVPVLSIILVLSSVPALPLMQA